MMWSGARLAFPGSPRRRHDHPAGRAPRRTRQAAAQLVDELIAKGYVQRGRHPDDARARLITLTERGWACTRAADAATADAVRPWAAILGEQRLRALQDDLLRIAPHGPVRPTW